LQLAAEAHSSQAKETFESLAESWLRLAADLESARALLKEWGSSVQRPS
jgi:hypothetical protein